MQLSINMISSRQNFLELKIAIKKSPDLIKLRVG